MSDGDGNSATGGQLSLLELAPGYTDPALPPEKREGCASIPRPCNRYRCVHNLVPETERAGRPHHGAHAPTVLRADVVDSCELDVSERGAHSRKQVGSQLGITPERVMQLEQRSMRKLGVALGIEAAIEELRGKLEGKAAIETVYPRTNDPHRVCVVVVVATIDEQAPIAPGVLVRKRK